MEAVKPKHLKPVIFLVCLLPLARLGWKALNHGLGANPIQVITFSTGTWTLVFLMLTLTVTPARKLSMLFWLIQYRRMLGLFAFFYGSLHFLTYLWLDQFFDIHSIYKDIFKRPFITAGFTGFVLMVPLALTSTRKAIRRLGKRWQLLHRLIYVSSIAGVIHYIWLVKKDVRTPLVYAAVLAILLLYRILAKVLAPASAHSAPSPMTAQIKPSPVSGN
jgi:sulfoxide reductase heme-binding subunit YedZ